MKRNVAHNGFCISREVTFLSNMQVSAIKTPLFLNSLTRINPEIFVNNVGFFL